MKSVGECNMLCCTRCILYLKVNGIGLILRHYSRGLLRLHVTSSALLRLRRSRCLLQLRVVSDNKCESPQLAAVFLDLREPCIPSSLLHGICLFFGIFRLMRETKRAGLPPVLGTITSVPATSPVVLAIILAPSSTSTGGLHVEAWLPRPLPRAPYAFPALFPPCDFSFELKPPLLLLLFDDLVLLFAALQPFLRQLRPCPRPPCLRNSRAPPCTTVFSARPWLLVQRTAVASCTIIMNGNFPADLHGVIRRATIGYSFKV